MLVCWLTKAGAVPGCAVGARLRHLNSITTLMHRQSVAVVGTDNRMFLSCSCWQGLGALIVRVDAAEILRKLFWGGGAVSLATSSADFHVLKCRPADKLEDGTVNFLDIIALKVRR